MAQVPDEWMKILPAVAAAGALVYGYGYLTHRIDSLEQISNSRRSVVESVIEIRPAIQRLEVEVQALADEMAALRRVVDRELNTRDRMRERGR